MPLRFRLKKRLRGSPPHHCNRSDQCSRCHGAGDTVDRDYLSDLPKALVRYRRPGAVCVSPRSALTVAAQAAAVRSVRCAKAKALCPRLRKLRCGFPPAWTQDRVLRIPAKEKAGVWARRRRSVQSLRTSVGTSIHAQRRQHLCHGSITCPSRARARIEVPTVTGKRSYVSHPDAVRTEVRLRERGAPSLRDPNTHGDQFVEVQVILPEGDFGRDERAAAQVRSDEY